MRSEVIVNITSQPGNLTANDVSITSSVIEDLTDEAIINPEVCHKDSMIPRTLVCVHINFTPMSVK